MFYQVLCLSALHGQDSSKRASPSGFTLILSLTLLRISLDLTPDP